MEKTVLIDGREVKFKATAMTPFLFKEMTGSDLLAAKGDGDNLETYELAVSLAYVMAKQADPDIPEKEEWLDSFSLFGFAQAIPQISSLWTNSMKTTSTPKKKGAKRIVK